MDMKIGDTMVINGVLMRYAGDGRFTPASPLPPSGETLAKRFDAGGPLSGQPVCGGNL